MNLHDGHRIGVGIIGTLGSFLLEHWEKAPAALAALATAAFMTLSAIQKWRQLRRRK